MAQHLSITLAQPGQTLGNISGNAQRIRDAWEQARDSDLIIFPEMQLSGWPLDDLARNPMLVTRAEAELEKLVELTGSGGPAMLVGSIMRHDGALYNGAALLDHGRIAHIQFKHRLAHGPVLDEMRDFAPGPKPAPISFRGVKLGLLIGEDAGQPHLHRDLADAGAEILITMAADPFVADRDLRLATRAQAAAASAHLPMVFVNQLGGQDELVFDGASFATHHDGAIAARLAAWEGESLTTSWTRPAHITHSAHNARGLQCAAGAIAADTDMLHDIYCATVLSLRDYVTKNGFPGIVLGLSGGIDSALCAAIAVDALGAERVWCVMLPSQYTSQQSLDDAKGCVDALGCRYSTIPIAPAVGALTTMLADIFTGQDADLTEENMQSRLRGVTLMALSNKFGHMLMTTGNKSELGVGYATIYGDMAGGYNPLKDIYKTMVFELSRWRNTHHVAIGLGPHAMVMPQRVITKPPSAELRPDQQDEDSLPPYPVLDRILFGLIEEDKTVDQLAEDGLDRAIVTRIEHLLRLGEYKRRQAPPGVRISARGFGRGWQYPITHALRTG